MCVCGVKGRNSIATPCSLTFDPWQIWFKIKSVHLHMGYPWARYDKNPPRGCPDIAVTKFPIWTDGDPTFAPATIAPAMISRQQRVRVRVMTEVLVRGRVRIKIRIKD